MSRLAIRTLCNIANKSLLKKQAQEHFYSRGNLSTSAAIHARYFTPKHEWVDVESNVGTVGVSKYAADALGDIVYAQLPEVGDEVESGGEIGALESVKAASEVFSPVSGKVTAKNELVEDGPVLINQSPEANGWLIKLELTNPEEVGGLMSEADYKAFLGTLEDDH